MFLRAIYLSFIVEHGSRQVVHIGVTHSPTYVWLAQQIRKATPFGTVPCYLICDNDSKYGLHIERAVSSAYIELVPIPEAAPQANAMCERFIGSVRREDQDHVLLLNEQHSLNHPGGRL